MTGSSPRLCSALQHRSHLPELCMGHPHLWLLLPWHRHSAPPALAHCSSGAQEGQRPLWHHGGTGPLCHPRWAGRWPVKALLWQVFLCPAVGAGKPHTWPFSHHRKLSLCRTDLAPASTGDYAALGSSGLCFDPGMDLGGINMTFPPTPGTTILPPTHPFHEPGLDPSQHLC